MSINSNKGMHAGRFSTEYHLGIQELFTTYTENICNNYDYISIYIELETHL
jgi:hypothetical protein